jgi:hypothetical protein
MFIQNSKLSNTKKNSSLKSLSQLEPNFAEIMFEKVFTKKMYLVAIKPKKLAHDRQLLFLFVTFS